MASTDTNTIQFDGGLLHVLDGQPHFRMAFYGIYRYEIRGSTLGKLDLVSQKLPGYSLLVDQNLAQAVKTGQLQDHVVVDTIYVDFNKILQSVDYVEGHPKWYVRTWLPGVLDGGVWLYEMPANRARGVILPGGDYERYTVALARSGRHEGCLTCANLG